VEDMPGTVTVRKVIGIAVLEDTIRGIAKALSDSCFNSLGIQITMDRESATAIIEMNRKMTQAEYQSCANSMFPIC